jgi:protein tyrosine phosphatase (PTP) superfamily phosphohydrolase (DUF442 family)
MNPDGVDAEGWAAIARAGISTIVDLRNDDEVRAAPGRPTALTVIRRPIEDQNDAEFMSVWGSRLGTPAYYPEILRRWPALVASAIASIADAPGPVLFHCAAGRDRTGMISAMIEELVGVDRSSILDDYAAAVRAFNVWKHANPVREKPQADAEVDAHLAIALPELTAFLDGLDIAQYLLHAGLTELQVDRIRTKLLDV